MMMSGNINSWDWGTPSNNYALAPLTRQGQFINRSSHLVFIIHDEYFLLIQLKCEFSFSVHKDKFSVMSKFSCVLTFPNSNDTGKKYNGVKEKVIVQCSKNIN